MIYTIETWIKLWLGTIKNETNNFANFQLNFLKFKSGNGYTNEKVGERVSLPTKVGERCSPTIHHWSGRKRCILFDRYKWEVEGEQTSERYKWYKVALTPTVSPGVIYRLAWHCHYIDSPSYTLTSHPNSFTEFSFVSSLHELNRMAESAPC